MNTVNENSQNADVAVVGAGPVGMLLALLLGRKGHKVTVIERWPNPYDQPRAVTFDHEIARILSIIGINSDNDPTITYYDELYYWKNAARENLSIVDWKSISSSGWRVRYWFSQPALEARLRGLVAAMPAVQLLTGWEVDSLVQDDEGVTIAGHANRKGVDPTTAISVRAKYVVGADGANSFVRNALGIGITDLGFSYNWLILDMIPPDGYEMTPAQWQLCDPVRPTTVVPGGPGRRRWEFMMLPGESKELLTRPETAWRLLKPWGLTPENSVLERNAIYQFQARWAKEWRVGRGLIAGDAAHLMPPFAGEGMCAGLRDAVALAWRFDGILSGLLGEQVLESYTGERLHHVKHYIDFSIWLGSIICITDPAAAAERDERMKRELQDLKDVPVPTDKAAIGPGIWWNGAIYGGELSVQGIVEVGGARGRFDDVVGRGWIVMGLNQSPAEALTPQQLEVLRRIGGKTVVIGRKGDPCDVIDTDGTYTRWLNSANCVYAVIRPDFYVASTATRPEQLRDQLGTLFTRLHVNEAMLAHGCI